jgi:DnaJ-class molecular chaperone
MEANRKTRKVICSVCNGNGFVRVPYEQVREEQWADCDFCNNQGEIEEEVNEDADGQRNPN